MMKKMLTICMIVAMLAATGIARATVTGNPEPDGWTFTGHSLEMGIYGKGSANYGFNTYSSIISVASGSILDITDGNFSWLAGDTVIGVGGKFVDITPSEAGWDSFSGRAVNSLLTPPGIYPEYGPKLQIKLGTANATWSASTVAPGAGDGSTSTRDGGDGTVHFRTSGWFHAHTPLQGQLTDTTWSGNAGELLVLDKDSHIRRLHGGDFIRPDKRVARMIWTWDAGNEVVDTWQLLLNTSLLDRMAPEGFTGLTPTAGDLAIWSVQDRDSSFTDAVVAVIPEPATMILLGMGLLAGVAGLKKKKA